MGYCRCAYLLSSFVSLAEELGVPLADEKIEGFTMVLTFLGIELDTVWQFSKLIGTKLAELQDCITIFKS